MEPWWSTYFLSKKQGQTFSNNQIGKPVWIPNRILENHWLDELSLGNAMIKVGLRLQGSAGKTKRPIDIWQLAESVSMGLLLSSFWRVGFLKFWDVDLLGGLSRLGKREKTLHLIHDGIYRYHHMAHIVVTLWPTYLQKDQAVAASFFLKLSWHSPFSASLSNALTIAIPDLVRSLNTVMSTKNTNSWMNMVLSTSSHT